MFIFKVDFFMHFYIKIKCMHFFSMKQIIPGIFLEFLILPSDISFFYLRFCSFPNTLFFNYSVIELEIC